MKTFFSDKLIELRQQRNISLSQIAFYLDYSIDEYITFEEGLGFPPKECFEKIKEFFQLEDKDLMPMSLDTYNIDFSYDDRMWIFQYDYAEKEVKDTMRPIVEMILAKYV